MATLGKTAERLADRKGSALTRADVEALLGQREWAKDARRITVGRLFYVDLLRAVKRYARGFTKDERESLRSDALLWLTERTEHGEPRNEYGEVAIAPETGKVFQLGAKGELPLRRDWLDENGRPTMGAWRAMKAAIQASADAPRRIGKAPANVIPMEGETLGLLAEREQRAEALEDRSAVIIDANALDLARVLGLPENGGRALIAKAFALSLDECADEWNVSRETAESAISKGKRILASRYPEPFDLLESLRAGVIALSAIREDSAREAIREYVRFPQDETLEREALKAARDWQSGKRQLPPQRAAIISALVRNLARGNLEAEDVAARAELIAECLGRLLRAEAKRASDNVRKGKRVGVGGKVPMGGTQPLDLGGVRTFASPFEDEQAKARERLERMHAEREQIAERRAYFAAHPTDWVEADAPKAPINTRRASSAPPAPMYETEAWSKGIKL